MLMMQSSYDTTLSANNREELILVVVTNSNSSGVPPSSPLPTCQAIAFVFIVIFVTLIYAPNSKQPHLCGRKQLGHGLMVSWGLLLAIHRRSRQDGWTDESSNDLLTTLSGLWNNGSATAASVLSLTQDVYDCSATAIVGFSDSITFCLNHTYLQETTTPFAVSTLQQYWFWEAQKMAINTSNPFRGSTLFVPMPLRHAHLLQLMVLIRPMLQVGWIQILQQLHPPSLKLALHWHPSFNTEHPFSFISSTNNLYLDNLTFLLIDLFSPKSRSGRYEEVNGHCFSRMNLCSVEEIKMKFDEVKVLFVTCLGITCPFFSEKKFVACIVDEAG
ncbi:hypothetical protein QQP08_020663 [Theobroma cacao]|nr:hypothetical protein QQP08_020663 [Theobroma cacao]